MNSTPRLRSAYPSTPQSELRPRQLGDGLRRSFGTPLSGSSNERYSQPQQARAQPILQQKNARNASANIIPFELADAPTQRAYVVGLYLALQAWKISNCWQVLDELDSTWYFLKWSVLDLLFLFGLPALRIPWLEWSFFTTLTVYLIHFIFNVFIMFRIPIPVLAWAGALMKVFYDRELSISDHRVDPAGILHNSSLILGRQIIQILPEGSAILNPGNKAFCLGELTRSVLLPIQVNQTTPALIELLRYDLETHESETIIIGAKQIRQMKRQAEKSLEKADKASPRTLHYTIKRTGLYQLQRVIDETKLEVRRRNFDTLIAPCPQAFVKTGKVDKCKGDLSDVTLGVTGVPPFKVTYSKQINNQQSTSSLQTIQPSGLDSPLAMGEPSSTLVDPRNINLDWTRSVEVTVPVNESLTIDGSWTYTISQVEDGVGNLVQYDMETSEESNHLFGTMLKQQLEVHNRPEVFFDGCNSLEALQVAREDFIRMPLGIHSDGPLKRDDWPLEMIYHFEPEHIGELDVPVEKHKFELSTDLIPPRISKAGKYMLDHVNSRFCGGKVSEPSSCVVTNPPRPVVELSKEDLSDVCAGNTVGLKIDFDFTGTPPFNLRYKVTHEGSSEFKVADFDGLRGQLEFRPKFAGSYEYEFLELQDKFYGPLSLKSVPNRLLRQDLKPLASARFWSGRDNVQACLGQAIFVDVQFFGEAPWKLDYELVAASKREKLSLLSDQPIHSISTPEFQTGGQQSLILTGVQDVSNCPQSIREEMSINVRHERPGAGFGQINGKHEVLALEGRPIRLPLRLKGNGPWTLDIMNRNMSLGPSTVAINEANGVFEVEQPGTYEILNVHDTCPGVVDEATNMFVVSWIDRPALFIPPSAALAEGPSAYRRSEVCEGEDDALPITLTGNPPYTIKYEQRSQPLKGSKSVSNKAPLVAALGSASIPMDTSRAGNYVYTFKELGDDRYAFSKQHFQPVTVSQRVHSLPSAKFGSPGKTYPLCKNTLQDPSLSLMIEPNHPSSPDPNAEEIPIFLDGLAPFSVELAITHHGKPHPEIIRLKDVPENRLLWTVPRRGLDLGTHSVSIRSVKDARGCSRILDNDPSSVRIRVSDPPAIIPLEYQSDYCVGEHISFSLSGQPPFQIFYTFQGRERKATVSSSTTFRRIADAPGDFVITGISDSASGRCKAEVEIRKVIHPMPSVQISRGKESRVEIHEGGEVDIRFDFTGEPPFEFT